MQLGKHASIYFIFGIFAYMYCFFLIIYAMMMLENIFLFICLGSYVDMSILACFHMYIHVGTKVHIHICVCVCVCVYACVRACVCEFCTCIITYTYTCPCKENLILGSIDENANVGCH